MNRLKHLQLTLPQNLKDNKNLVFMILDYGDKQGVGRWIKKKFPEQIQRGRLIYYQNQEPSYFHMAHAKNMAHRCALMEKADILVNVDADNYIGKGFASYTNNMFAHHANIYMRTGDRVKAETRGLAGRIIVKSTDFQILVGYDELFDKWGPDDRDFADRLKRVQLKQVDIDPIFLENIAHSDEQRVGNYDNSITADDIAVAFISKFRLTGRDHIIFVNSSNQGCFAGKGMVYRNFSSNPTRIKPYFSKNNIPKARSQIESYQPVEKMANVP